MVVTTIGLASSDLDRSDTSDDGIHRIIVAKVAASMREAIPGMFGSI